MRRFLLAMAVLALLADWHDCRGQPLGPGAGGSVLKDPFAAPAPMTPTPAPGTVEALINPASQSGAAANPAWQLPPQKPDINQDIQVTKELGTWLIMVQSYTTPEASIMARQMVQELRATYKLHAYTFNYGAEEKRKEYERVKKVIEDQRAFLLKNGLPLDDHVRVRTIHIEEQVGVLIGGYPTEEAARRALDGIRKLKPPDPNRVKLSVGFFGTGDITKYGKLNNAEGGYVNPFKTAFIAHNPKIEWKRPADWDKPDMNELRKLNAYETYSLLSCKKPFTLAVKEFPTPTIVQAKSGGGAFLDNLGLGGKSGQREDAAAKSARLLAEWLRAGRIEGYVLHTRYRSFVCVGNYEKSDDPNLRTMKEVLESRVMPQIAWRFPALPGQTMTQPRVQVMQVPR